MATPIESASRETQAFLRAPAGDNTYCLATVETVRNGLQYSGRILDFPAPQDNAVDDFGIQQGGGFTVEIADEPNDDEWPILDQAGDFMQTNDGTGILVQNY